MTVLPPHNTPAPHLDQRVTLRPAHARHVGGDGIGQALQAGGVAGVGLGGGAALKGEGLQAGEGLGDVSAGPQDHSHTKMLPVHLTLASTVSTNLGQGQAGGGCRPLLQLFLQLSINHLCQQLALRRGQGSGVLGSAAEGTSCHDHVWGGALTT